MTTVNLAQASNAGGGSHPSLGRGDGGSRRVPRSPEHLFSCPPDFFDGAAVYRGGNEEYTDSHNVESEKDKQHSVQSGGSVDVSRAGSSGQRSQENRGEEEEEEAVAKWTCISCRATFQSSEEHRSHFKSDYHRLNVKRRVVGKEPIDEDEFEAVVAEGRTRADDDDLSSISGSDDESDDDDQTATRAHVLPRSNRIYFVLPDLKEVLSIWRSVLIEEKEYLPGEKGDDNGELCVRDDDLLSRLKSLISPRPENDESSYHRLTWIVLLMAGGHFAGIVANERGEVLDHHTFHRYVVRAKAGGRQSTQDKGGRAPKSAGASLRRYNEAALQKEVRDLLDSWADYLLSASHIFVYAPSANGQALYGGERAHLSRNDPRVRRIPLTTRRPTYKEAKRVHHILAGISYEEEVQIANEMSKGGMIVNGRKEVVKKGSKAGDTSSKKAKEGVSSKGHDLSRIGADGTRSSSADVPPLLTSREPAEDESAKLDARLHEAAKCGDCDLVLSLLEAGSDPRTKDEGGYTPYGRAKDKEARNVFRRFMAGHPELWDWHAAGVPSALTEEMEVAQAAKQAEKDMKRKEREKERRKQKKEQTKAKEAHKRATELEATALANVRGTASSKQPAKGASSSTHSAGYQEAVLKAQAEERERRAAAAEIRMRALIASKEPDSHHQVTPSTSANAEMRSTSVDTKERCCSCCGDSLQGKIPFHRFSYQYCSTTCVQVHKKYLEND